MPSWILLSALVVLPTVLALLIVGFAPNRAEAVVRVLREARTTSRLVEVLPRMRQHACSCGRQAASPDGDPDDLPRR